MKLLAVDRGNSFTKFGLFSEEQLIEIRVATDAEIPQVLHELQATSIESVIISSVRGDSFTLRDFLNTDFSELQLNTSCKFPFEITYDNYQSVGVDRLANIAGAMVEKGKEEPILVIDCGTCITYSLALNGQFVGGAIAPGITMRLQALHHFTGKLPLFQAKAELPTIPGTSTEGSIRVGSELAALLETEAMILHFRNNTPRLNVLLTGGGMSFFERHLKSPIFATPYLTLKGLHEIYKYNT